MRGYDLFHAHEAKITERSTVEVLWFFHHIFSVA